MNERDLREIMSSLVAEERRLREQHDADPRELARIADQRQLVMAELRKLRGEQSGPIDLRNAS